jgi:hypothetical protein
VYGSGRTPLPGRHPVLAHSVCSGDTSVRDLWVAQSVVRADSVTDPSDDDIVQVFRVPAAVRVHWVEFAEHPTPIVDVNDIGTLSLVDPAGVTQPQATMPAALVWSNMPFFSAGSPQWHTHFDFDRTATLQPARDYWLVLHTGRSHRFYTRRVTSADHAMFGPLIGPVWWRYGAGFPWVQTTECALDFRVVGELVPTIDVPQAAVDAGELRLRVLANPAHGAVAFAWSGARGPLRFEVLDVRGRRVGEGTAPAGPAGRWSWSATRADGGPLPNAVYFVRARDASGREASERVVVVR